MVKFPKTVKVMGREIKILFPYAFSERSDITGQCLIGLEELRVADRDDIGVGKPDREIVTTFLHEVLHAIDTLTGHKIFHENEKAICGISEGLLQVIVDNPEVVKNVLKGVGMGDILKCD